MGNPGSSSIDSSEIEYFEAPVSDITHTNVSGQTVAKNVRSSKEPVPSPIIINSGLYLLMKWEYDFWLIWFNINRKDSITEFLWYTTALHPLAMPGSIPKMKALSDVLSPGWRSLCLRFKAKFSNAIVSAILLHSSKNSFRSFGIKKLVKQEDIDFTTMSKQELRVTFVEELRVWIEADLGTIALYNPMISSVVTEDSIWK